MFESLAISNRRYVTLENLEILEILHFVSDVGRSSDPLRRIAA